MVYYYYTFIIILLSNIIQINSYNEKYSPTFIKYNALNKYYNKIKEKYNINIQIKEKNDVIKEILINSSYFYNNYEFEYIYSGKFLYLNDSGLDYITKEYYKQKWILLMRSYSALYNYISNYKDIIMKLTKVIIVPKNLIAHIDKIAINCHKNLSIYVIELEEDIFNKFVYKYTNDSYSANIIAKQYELFLYLELTQKSFIIMILLIIFILVYRAIIKKNIEKKIKFQERIYSILIIKFFIIFLLFIELNYFNHYHQNGFFFLLSYFLIIFNKSLITIFILDTFSGIGLFIRIPINYSIIIYYLGTLSLLLPISVKIFFVSFGIPYSFMMNLFLYIQILFVISYFSIKNIIFLIKIKIKIHKIRKYNVYKRSIRHKMYIVIAQFIIFIIYFYYYYSLNEIILLKNELCYELEIVTLFECLEICFILIIGLFYFPVNMYGFNHFLYIIKNKTNKIKIRNKYKSNLPITDFNNIKQTQNDNFKKPIVVLNPKAFLHEQIKDNKINEERISYNNLQIGKIIFSNE